jgi:hypothetical protein
MDGQAAAKAIVEAGRGNITIRPAALPGERGFDILFHSPGSAPEAMENGGGIHTDTKDGTVREFFFLGPLTDYLFNTTDLTAEEFAQKFIDAYSIPNLHVVTFQGKQEWRYESPQGWSLAITQHKQVNVWVTSTRAFN